MKHCLQGKVRALKRLIMVFLLVMLTAGYATARPAKPRPVPETRPGFLIGYLEMKALPNSFAFIPDAPEPDSAVFVLDQAVSRSFLKLQGTDRWDLAIKDANLHFPEAANTFSCSLDAPITEADTPYLYQLLRRIVTDAGLSTYWAKLEYERHRPFMLNNKPICTPDEEAKLRKSGSYPSGHTAIGWAWALILSEIAPDRVGKIMARGRAFGESRKVCNVHWDSDVRQGRIIAAAVVAKLHSDPGFLYDLAAAKEEIAAVRPKRLSPTLDCKIEAAALSIKPE